VKNFPVDFSAYWKENILDEKYVVCFFSDKGTSDISAFDALTAARNVGLYAEIAELPQAQVELSNVAFGQAKAKKKTKVKLICDKGKRTMIWSRSEADVDFMLKKANTRIKDHIRHKAVELYEKDKGSIDILEESFVRDSIVHIEFEESPVELNLMQEECHTPPSEDPQALLGVHNMGRLFQSLFSTKSETHEKSENRDVNPVQSMHVAGQVQNYQHITALSRISGTDHPYGSAQDIGATAISTVEKSTNCMLTKNEKQSPENSIDRHWNLSTKLCRLQCALTLSLEPLFDEESNQDTDLRFVDAGKSPTHENLMVRYGDFDATLLTKEGFPAPMAGIQQKDRTSPSQTELDGRDAPESGEGVAKSVTEDTYEVALKQQQKSLLHPALVATDVHGIKGRIPGRPLGHLST